MPDQITAEIEPQLLQRYIAYARDRIFPRLTNEAEGYIRMEWGRLRRDVDRSKFRIAVRHLDALFRLSEASAKVRLSDTVELRDAERAVRVFRNYLREFDEDISSDRPENWVRLEQHVKDIMYGMTNGGRDDVPEGEVLRVMMEDLGIEPAKAKAVLNDLREDKVIYEPRKGKLRIVTG